MNRVWSGCPLTLNVDNSFTAFFDEYPGGMIGRAAAVAARLFEGLLGDSPPQTALGRSPCELHWRRTVDEWQEVACFSHEKYPD